MKTIQHLIIVVLISFLLSSCSGGGVCDPNSPTPPISELTLTITAPNEYPAGVAVTAYLTITNTSNTDAQNLYYEIPNSTNYTGATITVDNGTLQPCLNIAKQMSCTFPVYISADSHPGSFTVNATVNGYVSSNVEKLWQEIKNTVSTSVDTISLTANIGLTELSVNNQVGANGVTFLYAPVVTANPNGDTVVSIVGVVNSANAGEFNTLNLTTSDGVLLTFGVLSGNSGTGLSNLAIGSIVTYNLTIPRGVDSFTFYGQTVHNGDLVNQGTIAHVITLNSAVESLGILQVQPNLASLNESVSTQVFTYTNTGTGPLTEFTIVPQEPLSLVSTTCSQTLAVGASCTYSITFDASQPISGTASVIATANNGKTNQSVTSQVNYQGLNPEYGIEVNAMNGFNFVATTASPSVSTLITITNTGNTNESQIRFTLPNFFSLEQGDVNSCTLNSDNTSIVDTLTPNGDSRSCTLSLIYSNPNVVEATADLIIDYRYAANIQAPTTNIAMTYRTSQSSAALIITPLTSDDFGAIANNNSESKSRMFVVLNSSSDTAATGINFTVNSTPTSGIYSIVSNSCGSTLNLSESCLLTVKFGPSSASVGNESAVLNVNYIPYTAPSLGASINESVILTGSLRAALSANITSSFSATGFATGSGPGDTQPNSYQIESGSTGTILLSYTNSGPGVATGFTTTGVPNNWVKSGGSDCTNVIIGVNESCTDTYTLTRNSIGAANFTYNSIIASWSSEQGNQPSQTIIPLTGTPTYVNVYASPLISVVLSSSSSGTPSINSTSVESEFYIVYELSGGYQVADQTLSATFSGGNGTMSITTNPSTCTINSNNAICALAVNSGTTINGILNYTVTPTNSGSVVISSIPNPLTMEVIPNYAQIIIESIILTPIAKTGNGASESSFYIESNTVSQLMTIRYKNIGNGVAESFHISSANLSTGYSRNITSTCNNSVTGESIAVNGTCNLVLDVNTNSLGSQNLSLAAVNMPVSWVDESGVFSNQQVNWINPITNNSQDVVYVTLFNRAQVSAYLSSESTSLNQIESTPAGTNFYLYYNLTGGYPGQDFTYTPTLPNGMSIVGQPSCSLTAFGIVTCVIEVNPGTNSGSGSINFGGNSGGVTPSPQNQSILVVGTPYITFTTNLSGALKAGESFIITATLTESGNTISSQLIQKDSMTKNGNPYAGESFIFTPNSCSVATGQLSCDIVVSVESRAGFGDYTLTMEDNTSNIQLYDEIIDFSVLEGKSCGESDCIIFITKTFYNGNLKDGGGYTGSPPLPQTIPAATGTAAADILCQFEADTLAGSGAPAGSVFKAMLLSDIRYPCNSSGVCGEDGWLDWPVRPNTTYITRAEGSGSPVWITSVGSNGDGIFESSFDDYAIQEIDEHTNNINARKLWTGIVGVKLAAITGPGSPMVGWTALDLNAVWGGGQWAGFSNGGTCNN